MKVSFDGLRREIAVAYNDVVRNLDDVGGLPIGAVNAIGELKNLLGALMGCYDDSDADDCNDISEDVNLLDIKEGR